MEAKGVPLSERMTAGTPNSRKTLMNTGLASSIDVGVQPSALEQESAETVLDGKGIAVAAVEHLELTFEVDRPDRIGLVHGGEWLTGMARLTGASALLRDQVVTLEDAVDRPASWCLAELLSCEFTDLA